MLAPRLFAVLAVCIAASVAFGPANAEVIGDFTLPVRDIPGKTWLDLSRQVFPDIAASSAPNIAATATDMIAVHSIGVADDSWTNCGDRIDLAGLAFYPLRLAGKDRLILTPSIADDCVPLLVLFDDKGTLVDVVNVKGDQHAGLSADFVRPLGGAGSIGPPGALVTVTNWHDNSDQSYDDTMLLLVKPDGFSVIGDVPAFGSHTCRANLPKKRR